MKRRNGGGQGWLGASPGSLRAPANIKLIIKSIGVFGNREILLQPYSMRYLFAAYNLIGNVHVGKYERRVLFRRCMCRISSSRHHYSGMVFLWHALARYVWCLLLAVCRKASIRGIIRTAAALNTMASQWRHWRRHCSPGVAASSLIMSAMKCRPERPGTIELVGLHRGADVSGRGGWHWPEAFVPMGWWPMAAAIGRQ